MQSRFLIALIAPFALTGCLAQSQIQGKYMDSQEECRNETARSVAGGETAKPVTENQASPIAQRFSDCMAKEGWHLSTPKAPTAVAATTPPTGSSYPKTVTGPAASAYPPASSYPVYAPYQQPAGATAVTHATPVVAAPAAAVAAPVAANAAAPAARTAASVPSVPSVPSQTSIPTSPDVATYQPGRPSGEATPYYGTGPGRQF